MKFLKTKTYKYNPNEKGTGELRVCTLYLKIDCIAMVKEEPFLEDRSTIITTTGEEFIAKESADSIMERIKSLTLDQPEP